MAQGESDVAQGEFDSRDGIMYIPQGKSNAAQGKVDFPYEMSCCYGVNRINTKAIADISERMLFGIVSQYGKNSEEFRMVNSPQRNRRTTAKSREPTLNSTDAGKKTRSVMSTPEPEVSKNGSHH